MIPSLQLGQTGRGGTVAYNLNSAFHWTTTGASNDSGAASLQSSNQVFRHAVGATGHSAYYRTATAISGRTYCEFSPIARPSALPLAIGVTDTPGVFHNGTAPANSASMHSGSGGGCGLTTPGYQNGGTLTSSGSYSFTLNDRLMVAFDPATRKIWFGKNGTWISGDPAAGTGQTTTIAGGSTFYFWAADYTCLISSGTFDLAIYPHAAQQLYNPPAGFGRYQP